MAHALKAEDIQASGQWESSHEAVQKRWPAEARQQAFIQFLQTRFDHTQLQAIEVQTRHMPPCLLIQSCLHAWWGVECQKVFACTGGLQGVLG